MKLKELKSKLKWSRKKTWIAAAALLVLAISFFMFPKEGEGYDYLELKEGPYTEKVLAVGQMGLQGETSIIAQVRGTVQSLGGKDGETLPEGSLLLSIYDPDHEFLLAQKESGYLDAREQYNSVLEVDYPSGIQELNRLAQNVERARKDAEDAKILLAEGAISQNAYSDYQNALLTAETLWKSEKLRVDALAAGGSKRESLKYRMENAKAQYDSTALQESDFNIRASMDTIILKSYVQAGDSVNPGDLLLDVAGSGQYQVTAELDEKYLLFLKEGMEAVIRVEGTDKKLSGKLESISPKINKNTGTFPITVLVLDTPDFNASDLTVNIEITLTEEEKVLTLPKQYVTEQGTVFLYEGGALREMAIEFRSGPGADVILEKGLKAGDKILLPMPDLEDGMQVRLGKGADAA
jgi:multidrug resistance efflux pump